MDLFKTKTSIADFRAGGFRGTVLALYLCAPDDDLLAAGCSDGMIAATRFLLTKHNVGDCRDIGCSPTDCKDAGFRAKVVSTECKRIHDGRGFEGVEIIAE